MSFNVRYGRARDGANAWPNRREIVFETIRDRAPDVVGLQEALRFQMDEIRSGVPGYGEVGVGRDGGTKGEYSGVLYREARFDVAESGTFWLSDTPEVPSRHWGNDCIRICTWARLVEKAPGGRGFYLFNTHLDHRSQPSREKGARLIARRIASRARPDPVVLTGDLNAGERNPAVLYLLGRTGPDRPADATPVPLVDTFRVLHPKQKNVGTFNGFRGAAAGAKIDYVLVQPGTEVLEAEIVRASRDGRYPSDHFPVTARVRWRLAD
jgi:endonuclease/exonuclease/phosphatase family metal-dependent hydrolase